jgi:predicted nucleic acid-binding protein
MIGKRLLIDVNVMLDVLLDRRPFADAASAVWTFVERGVAEGYLSAHAITTLHYLNAREVGAVTARETADALLTVFDVAPVDRGVLNAALALGWDDFEDAVTASAARRAQCEVIVTRNPQDFRRSPVRVLTPSEVVAWLETAGGHDL